MIKKEQIENWGQPLQRSKIYPNLVYKAYETILMPRITFSLTNTTLMQPEINNLQTKADKYYIPKLGLSSKFPRVVLRGSYKFGGFNQSTLQMSQTHKQIQMIIGCTRDQNDTGTLLECSINIIQLEAGVTTPILSADTPPDFIHYTTRTWIHSIKESLIQIKGSINLPIFWYPKLQREGDTNIMTEILKRHPVHHLTKNGQRKKIRYNETLVKLLNRCRTYLQVITIAHMTNLDGITISSLYLQEQRDPNRNSR